MASFANGEKQVAPSSSDANPLRLNRRRASLPPPPPDQDDSDGEDMSEILCALQSCDDRHVEYTIDEHDAMNNSMALTDLSDPKFSMPLRDGPMVMRRKRFAARVTNPIRSILRNGNGCKRGKTRRLSDEFKRLSFALSPTFISEHGKRKEKGAPDPNSNESILSLDGDSLFNSDESNAQEASLKLGDSSDEKPTRRSSFTQVKAKSTLGFDERFVGLSESDLGSLANLSFSSV